MHIQCTGIYIQALCMHTGIPLTFTACRTYKHAGTHTHMQVHIQTCTPFLHMHTTDYQVPNFSTVWYIIFEHESVLDLKQSTLSPLAQLF